VSRSERRSAISTQYYGAETVPNPAESSVHIEIQVPKQGQQHYANQNHPDDSQHPEAFANCKLFHRFSSAPRWPMVVHEDDGPKIQSQNREQSRHARGLLLQVIQWNAVIRIPTARQDLVPI
jgi:hypothetical protein